MNLAHLIQEIEKINQQIEYAADDISDEMLSVFKKEKKSIEKSYQLTMLRQALLTDAEQIVQEGMEELSRQQENYDQLCNHIHSIRQAIASDFKGETGKAIDATLHEQAMKIGSYLKEKSTHFTRTLRTNNPGFYR